MYEMEIIHETFRLSAAFRSRRAAEREKISQETGITPPEGYGRILRELSKHRTVSQNELASLLEIRPQSLTVAMIKLEIQGFVIRERSAKDRRQILVTITDAGRAHSTKLGEERNRTAQELLSGLTEEEKEELYTLLRKIRSAGSEQQEE